MILRRFTEHVKQQNWFAVWLDLVVVVAGIYIGLQADAWMSAQKDREIEREYLERLLADMDESIEAQRNDQRIFDASLAATDYVAEIQRAGTFDDVDRASTTVSSSPLALVTRVDGQLIAHPIGRGQSRENRPGDSRYRPDIRGPRGHVSLHASRRLAVRLAR